MCLFLFCFVSIFKICLFDGFEGLRSYGKVVYAFGTLPILGYFIICVKVLGYSSSVPSSGVGGVLDRTPWNEFFTDTKVTSAFKYLS
jgi:hypothetical protein